MEGAIVVMMYMVDAPYTVEEPAEWEPEARGDDAPGSFSAGASERPPVRDERGLNQPGVPPYFADIMREEDELWEAQNDIGTKL